MHVRVVLAGGQRHVVWSLGGEGSLQRRVLVIELVLEMRHCGEALPSLAHLHGYEVVLVRSVSQCMHVHHLSDSLPRPKLNF